MLKTLPSGPVSYCLGLSTMDSRSISFVSCQCHHIMTPTHGMILEGVLTSPLVCRDRHDKNDYEDGCALKCECVIETFRPGKQAMETAGPAARRLRRAETYLVPKRCVVLLLVLLLMLDRPGRGLPKCSLRPAMSLSGVAACSPSRNHSCRRRPCWTVPANGRRPHYRRPGSSGSGWAWGDSARRRSRYGGRMGAGPRVAAEEGRGCQRSVSPVFCPDDGIRRRRRRR